MAPGGSCIVNGGIVGRGGFQAAAWAVWPRTRQTSFHSACITLRWRSRQHSDVALKRNIPNSYV